MVYEHDIPRESLSSLLQAHIRHCLQVILRLTTAVDNSDIILVRSENLYCFYAPDALVTTEVVEVLAAALLSKIRIASVRSEANSCLWFAMRKHGTQGTQCSGGSSVEHWGGPFSLQRAWLEELAPNGVAGRKFPRMLLLLWDHSKSTERKKLPC